MTLSLNDIQQKLEEFEIKFKEVESTNKILLRQIEELYVLYHAVKKLNKAKNHKEVFSTLTSILSKDFNIEEFAVFIYNPKLKILNIQFSNGLTKRDIKEFFYRSNEGLVGKVFIAATPLYLQDVSIYKNFRYYQMDKKVQGCILYLPLKISSNEIFGVLKLRKPTPNSFSDIDQKLLTQLSEQFSLSIKKSMSIDTINRYAWMDELTGLYTKKYFEKRFDAEIRRSQRYQHSLSVINLIIENFNLIIKNHGKESGNIILKDFASFLLANTRMCDICFRYSTNQFLILLPESHKNSAEEVVKKIQMSWKNREIVLNEDLPVSINLSARFASYPKDTIEPPVLLRMIFESSKNGIKKMSN